MNAMKKLVNGFIKYKVGAIVVVVVSDFAVAAVVAAVAAVVAVVAAVVAEKEHSELGIRWQEKKTLTTVFNVTAKKCAMSRYMKDKSFIKADL